LQGSKQGSNPCPPSYHFNTLARFFCGAMMVQWCNWYPNHRDCEGKVMGKKRKTMKVIDPAQKLTTTQRDALTPVNGMIIYNSTTGQFECYQEPKTESFKNLSKIILVFNEGNEIIIDAERIETFNLSLKKTNISKIVRRKR